MNILKLSDEHVINLDHVVDMKIVDFQDDKGNPVYAIMFQTNLIDCIKVIPNSPDEDDYETSHCQVREYIYNYEVSPTYKTLKEAELLLDSIFKQIKKGER